MQTRAGRVPGGTIVLSENERNDQERSHRSEKTNGKNAFLKILERLVKERNGTERELLEKNG